MGRKVKEDVITTICGGEKQIWHNRAEALTHFTDLMVMTEGSEQGRYAKIVRDIKSGEEVCSDEDA